MAERNENEFLDDLDALEAALDEQEKAEPTEEELAADELAKKLVLFCSPSMTTL